MLTFLVICFLLLFLSSRDAFVVVGYRLPGTSLLILHAQNLKLFLPVRMVGSGTYVQGQRK
jgi:hypothetical protein